MKNSAFWPVILLFGMVITPACAQPGGISTLGALQGEWVQQDTSPADTVRMTIKSNRLTRHYPDEADTTITIVVYNDLHCTTEDRYGSFIYLTDDAVCAAVDIIGKDLVRLSPLHPDASPELYRRAENHKKEGTLRQSRISGYGKTPNAAISGHNNRKLSNVSPEDCMHACDAEKNFLCKSFDYNRIERTCDLSDRSATDVNGLKTDYPGNPYDHYTKKTFLAAHAMSATTNRYKLTPNAAISGYNDRKLINVNPEDCVIACDTERNFACKSFDYYKKERACDLSSKRADEVGGLKTDYPGNPYDHYEQQ